MSHRDTTKYGGCAAAQELFQALTTTTPPNPTSRNKVSYSSVHVKLIKWLLFRVNNPSFKGKHSNNHSILTMYLIDTQTGLGVWVKARSWSAGEPARTRASKVH